MAGATISDVKNRLSAYLRRVRAGETVVIMDRKTPIAVLAPIGGAASVESRLEKLLAAGTLVREAGGRGEEESAPTDTLLRQPVALKEPVDLLEVLLDERRLGR